MCDSTKKISPLLPDRRKQAELFVCDIFDAVPKGDIASMEHPIFSLSTNPDMKSRRYEHGNKWLEVHPSSYGLATVHDRDILIFCISQVIAAINEGRSISKTLSFNAIDLLIATNRGTDGRAYLRLKSAMNRLQGTQIETNILTGSKEQIDIFSLVDKVKIVRESRDGQMLEIEITISDWVFNAIEAKEVLTYSPKYFRLRKPLERRFYDLARKHCGQKENWSISTKKLKNKSGSTSSMGEFNRLLENISTDDKEHNHMPDYSIRYALDRNENENKNIVEFKNRKPKRKLETRLVDFPILSAETYEKARKVAPQFDVYYLEREWHEMWYTKGQEKLHNPDGAFIAFCKKRYMADKGGFI